ncbi:hypothetical protein [Corallococcus aberystwythensis]|uniref:Glycosyltransferase family 2 protein n=1 Tax=Corallococcus aberystwythensis TaxID=2316722 RepID=A0A3A8QWF8_9BACT|nr:hypothetical protein [Corallococcus aberystwythensis]RKH67464.1 hypothetical protein D7W81_13905 [Corallococcus aberystwythensis]
MVLEQKREPTRDAPRLAFAVMHAAFDAARAPVLQRLEETLRSGLGAGDVLHVERDTVRRGVWNVASACWRWGISQAARGITHVVVLNDDAEPCPGFVEAVRAALAARPAHPVCFYANHETALAAYAQGEAWWTSDDGLVGVTCALPVDLAGDFLAWADTALLERTPRGLPDDTRLNIWAMAHRRPIWHARGLVEHGEPETSLVGNAHHEGRRSLTPVPATDAEARAIDWSRGLESPLHALVYGVSPIHLLREVKPEVRERMGLEHVVDELWGEAAPQCRAFYGARP